MVFGRLAGWGLVLLAIVMASAEAVMALGASAYSGLATADIWKLLVGQTPSFAVDADSLQLFAALGTGILQMPAWIVFGVFGFLIAHICRKRRSPRRSFRTIN